MTAELTARNIQVIQHAADGLTIKESARKAGLSIETIKTHRQIALARIGAATISQAVAIALRRGVIQ